MSKIVCVEFENRKTLVQKYEVSFTVSDQRTDVTAITKELCKNQDVLEM